MDTESQVVPLGIASAICSETPQECEPFSRSFTKLRYLINWGGVLTTFPNIQNSKGSESKFSEDAGRDALPEAESDAVPDSLQDISTAKPIFEELTIFSAIMERDIARMQKTRIPEIRLNHEFGFTVLKLDDPLLQLIEKNKPPDFDTFVTKLLGKRVCFDAVWEDSAWKILRLELEAVENTSSGDLPRQSPKELLLKKLCSRRAVIPSGSWCNGTITSMPFYDLAIASVGNLSVCVPMASLITDVLISPLWSHVDMFVNEGSLVAMKITQNEEGLISAEECWGTTGSGVSEGGKVDCESYVKWGSSGKIGTGVLKRNGADFYVGMENLDLPLPRDQIFLDGKLATDDQLNGSLCSRVTCTYQPEKVIRAWIGTFEPWELLKDKLVVPQGLVGLKSCLDAVVEEFPLPEHMICRIGVLPVLLFTEPTKFKRNFKRGDAVMLSVQEEKIVDGGCILLAKLLPPHNNYLRRFLNFRGQVSHIGTKFCTIRTVDAALDVLFDWTAAKPYKTPVTDYAKYFKQVREIITIGSHVHFNAIHPHNLPTAYCVELFIDVKP